MPSIRLADLAQQLDAELHGDGDIVITGVASMQSAKAGHITFMVNPKYREHLAACQASAVVMTQDDLPFAHSAALVVRNPYLTYARMAQILDTTPQPAQDIAPSAVIDATAKLGTHVAIGPNALEFPIKIDGADVHFIDTFIVGTAATKWSFSSLNDTFCSTTSPFQAMCIESY